VRRYECLQDRSCVAIFSDAPNGECCLLYAPLTVIKGTSLKGLSLTRRNCSWTPSGCGGTAPPFSCTGGCDGISLYPRRGVDEATKTPFVAIHAVLYTPAAAAAAASGTNAVGERQRRVATASNGARANAADANSEVMDVEVVKEEGVVTLTLTNSALFNSTSCESFELKLMAPNRTTTPLLPQCSDDGTSTVSMAAPQPWSVIVATPRSH